AVFRCADSAAQALISNARPERPAPEHAARSAYIWCRISSGFLVGWTIEECASPGNSSGTSAASRADTEILTAENGAQARALIGIPLGDSDRIVPLVAARPGSGRSVRKCFL